MRSAKAIFWGVILVLGFSFALEARPEGSQAVLERNNFQKFQQELGELDERVERGEVSIVGARKLQKKMAEKYGLTFGREQAEPLDPALLEGLDVLGIAPSVTPIEVIPYTASVSDRWNQVLAERHGKKSTFLGMSPLIFRVKRWTQPPSQEALGGADPHPFLTALDKQTILTPALVKVFSNPKSYLKQGWNVSKIRAIHLVPAEIEGEPAFKIPYVHKHRIKRKGQEEREEYSFYLPEGLGESEIIRIMAYLQRKADGEDEGEFSLYETLAQLPEQVTREANENLDGMDEDDEICPNDITIRDQRGGAREISPEKIAELWDKALTELPQPTKEELRDVRRMKEIMKKQGERKRAWDALEEMGSDDIVEKLRGIIFSSASPEIRSDAFQTLLNILGKRNDTEGLFGLLEQGISDPHLGGTAYSHLRDLWLWYDQDIQSPQRTRVETIIAGQLGDQTNGREAISFFLSRSDTSHSNQLRAISALDRYLATESLPEEQPVQFGNAMMYDDGNPRGLLGRLVDEVRQRLGLERSRNMFNIIKRKKTREENKDVAQSITNDDLHFVNQAMPVVLNHIALVKDRSLLEELVRSPLMPETYKGKLKERVRQLIQAERVELDQQLGDLGQ